MSCWEKAHRFYIPRGLFRTSKSGLQMPGQSNNRLIFVNVLLSSECYAAKRMAFCEVVGKRGGGRKTRKARKAKGTPGDLVVMDDDDSEASAYKEVAARLHDDSDSNIEEE